MKLGEIERNGREYDEDEFEKDTLIEESQKDVENYEDRADDSITANDEEVKKAELLMVAAVAPQNQAEGPQVSDQ